MEISFLTHFSSASLNELNKASVPVWLTGYFLREGVIEMNFVIVQLFGPPATDERTHRFGVLHRMIVAARDAHVHAGVDDAGRIAGLACRICLVGP